MVTSLGKAHERGGGFKSSFREGRRFICWTVALFLKTAKAAFPMIHFISFVLWILAVAVAPPVVSFCAVATPLLNGESLLCSPVGKYRRTEPIFIVSFPFFPTTTTVATLLSRSSFLTRSASIWFVVNAAPLRAPPPNIHPDMLP